MLRRSFIFLPGVGLSTEKAIWENGVLDWDGFVKSGVAGPLKGERKAASDHIVNEASRNLDEGNVGFFNGFFRPSENWRLWDEFGDGAVFLDIETTGTRRFSPITVVGAYDGREFRALVRGKNLDTSRIAGLFEDASMIVTFNGASFDLPMLEAQFPGSVPNIPHLDLRWLAIRCGFRGGLKSVERQMCIGRPEDVRGMSGEDAVRLWRIYERDSNRNALKLLLKYNMEDIINLSPITERLVETMRSRVFGGLLSAGGPPDR
ncbi:MAG: ribonuclease H-like domain-containing protein [Candidatus Thermoplasmatota archaeon]|nr:ribonuclease H-like domain-containing protein [Candidatus Thermoplasmatota archaeon]